MKNYLLLTALISSLALASSGSTSNPANVVSLGGVSLLDDLTISEANTPGYFTLYGGGITMTAANYAPLYKNGAVYQVTAGKTFQVVKVCFASGAVFNQMQLVSGTATIGVNSASITGGVFQGGATAIYQFVGNATANTYQCLNSTYAFAASTYAGFQANASNGYWVMVLGKEI